MAEQQRYAYNKKKGDSNRRTITDPTGKLPPNDTQIEEVVLGELMLEKDAYMNVSDLRVPESF